MIEVINLSKDFGTVKPLADINCTIKKGEIVSIIGPSGCGKSTFLRCLNRLETPTDGKILIDGQDITDKKTDINKIRQKIAMVFQSFNLFSHLTVLENITLGPIKLLKKSKAQADADATELLKSVGLAQKADAYPAELSGGQKQRVAIVRALAMNPEVLLFDEPTSALDPTMVGEVLAVMRALAEKGLTMLIVTHEMKFAQDISGRVLYMDEGIIYEDGPPSQIFLNPQKEKTRKFVKKLKSFNYVLKSRDFDFLAFNSDVENFGNKNLLSKKQIMDIQLVFEEICVQVLLERLSGDVNIIYDVEYSDKEKTINISVGFDGEEFNPLNLEDELSIKIIKRKAAKCEYKYENGKNLLNIYL